MNCVYMIDRFHVYRSFFVQSKWWLDEGIFDSSPGCLTRCSARHERKRLVSDECLHWRGSLERSGGSARVNANHCTVPSDSGEDGLRL